MEKLSPLSQTAELDLALNYPYDRPEHSYSITRSKVVAFPTNLMLSGRIPVIACGSNAAPKQLIRKYNAIETEPIYVSKAKLKNFLCCYSAHITSYGSIPATLAHTEGTATDCHITWLTKQQLEHMHKTEAVGSNYKFSKLENIDLLCSEAGHLTEAYSYVSLHGNIQDQGNPIAVAGINTSPAPTLQLDQISIQDKVRSEIAPNFSVSEFVAGNISNLQLRRARVGLVKKNARPFSYLYEKVILT
ncbi:MAG: hypothetical protein V7750_05270 [Sneathiella sp.]